METLRLQARDLRVGYAGKAVLEGVELQAEAGQLLCLIGPNGAGKTTLLRTLSRQLPPISGEITLEGRPLADFSARELAASLAVVLTGRPEPELLRCRELVALGRYPYTGRLGILSERDRELVARCMELTGTAELAERDFLQLSDGQRQRVLLARALCQEPKVLVLDEPSSYLDLQHKLRFMRLLRRLAETEKLAVVLSLHELTLARAFADRVLCLREGRLDRVGTPEEVFTPDYIERLYALEPGDAALFL